MFLVDDDQPCLFYGSIHTATTHSKKIPQFFETSDEARDFFIRKALISFEKSKERILSFEIHPKDIPEEKVGEKGDKVNINRQRYFLTTDYFSKETVSYDIQKAQDFIDSRMKKTSESIPPADFETKAVQEGWDHATYWRSNWFDIYNKVEKNNHIIGFIRDRLPDDGRQLDFVRPQDIVINARTGKFLHYSEELYTLDEGHLVLKCKTSELVVI